MVKRKGISTDQKAGRTSSKPHSLQATCNFDIWSTHSRVGTRLLHCPLSSVSISKSDAKDLT